MNFDDEINERYTGISERVLLVALKLADDDVRNAFCKTLSTDEQIQLQSKLNGLTQISPEDTINLRDSLHLVFMEMSRNGIFSA